MKTTDPDFTRALALAAEGWHGTPFVPLHGKHGAGVDCANLVYGVLSDAGLQMPDVGTPTFGRSVDTNYLQDMDRFLDAMPCFVKVDRSGPILPGDVLLFQVNQLRQHMAVALSATLMIHTWPSRGVCESDLRQSIWRKRLAGLYRYNNA